MVTRPLNDPTSWWYHANVHCNIDRLWKPWTRGGGRRHSATLEQGTVATSSAAPGGPKVLTALSPKPLGFAMATIKLEAAGPPPRLCTTP